MASEQGGGNVRWILVGTGDLVRKRLAAALTQTGGSAIAGIVGNPDRAAELARQWNARPFENLDQALDGCEADAVYIATPVDRHSRQANGALQRGKHVLVEKPLGLNAADAREIVSTATGAKVIAGCAYYRRCSPRFAHAQRILQSGDLGQIISIAMRYRAWFNPDPADPKYWRVIPSRSGGGPLSDVGSHMIDVLVGLLGMPKIVNAKARTLTHAYQAEDSALVTMEMTGGALASGSFHWNSRTWAHDFEIVGTTGSLKWAPYDGPKVTLTRGREVEELDLPNAANAHAPLIADFVRAIALKQPPAVPLDEALKTNLVLDAIYQSGKSQMEVAL